MKNGRFVGMVAAALVGSVVLYAQAAQAQTSILAPMYKVNFVRANDPCTMGNAVTVVNPGSINVCPEAHVTTDATSGWTKARLTVRAVRQGGAPTLRIQGKGFKAPAATKIGVQLTLRTTNTLGSPAGSKTYEDETIVCGTTSGTGCGKYFAPASNGGLSAGEPLSQCLTDNSLSTNLDNGNIEIIDAALINCDTGLVFAIPGTDQH